MHEKIILAPGINKSELFKNLALHGVDCLNLRIFSTVDLARYTLMKSGVSIDRAFLSVKEECVLVSRAVDEETYFGKTSYSDIKEISEAIRQIRSISVDGDEKTIIHDNLKNAIFFEKNAAIFRVYQKYMKLLCDSNAIDGISIIRKAIREGKELNAEIIKFKEITLTPLEESLLHTISGGNFSEISLSELYGVPEKVINIESYKNCYGSSNEVEIILNDIYKNKKLDTCTVAVTDTATYSQIFFDYALLYDIPITFGCGIPIINSNPARLLKLYYHWMTDGFFGGESLRKMIFCAAFDRDILYKIFPKKQDGFSYNILFEILSGLRLTNNKSINDDRIKMFKKTIDEEEQQISLENKRASRKINEKRMCIPYLEVMASELALPVEDFISKYALIRDGSKTYAEKLLKELDTTSANAIYDELKIICSSSVSLDEDDVILNVLRMNVCRQGSMEGSLYVTDMKGAVSTIRDNLYIAGLSATKFPGTPTESYLLLDDDLKRFGLKAEYLTSTGKIEAKKDLLNTLVHLASNIGSRIMISYAGLNVSELKRENASSTLFELFKEQNGGNISDRDFEEKIERIEYFEPDISATREVGKAIQKGKKIRQEAVSDSTVIDVDAWSDKEWSPSAIKSYFDCPKRFLLSYLLDISGPEEEKFLEVISASATGNLAHLLMEQLANSTMSKDEFIQMAGEYFDRYMSVNPPLINANVETAKGDFLEMMEKAFDTDSHREVVLKEEDVHCIHECGVKLHGFPDRVEKLDDGTYLIVDYKSGKNINHVQDDIDTCLQVVIYAYLMEKNGFPVSRGEFRYIRFGKAVTCKYDDKMKEALAKKLRFFKDAVTQLKFGCVVPMDKKDDPCKYCSYKSVCVR